MNIPNYTLPEIRQQMEEATTAPSREHFDSLFMHYNKLVADSRNEKQALGKLILFIRNYQPQKDEETILKDMLMTILVQHKL